MEPYQLIESDWKLFRKKIVEWQTAYIDKLNKEYIKILSREEDPAKKFWDLEKRIHYDKRCTGVLVTRMSRSRMTMIITDLINEKVITLDDLDEFSDELKNWMHYIFHR